MTPALAARRLRAVAPTIPEAARRLVGEDAIVLVPGLHELGRFETTHGRRVIVIRAELSAHERRWVLAHEMAHVLGLCDEEECDLVADLVAGAEARPAAA